MRFSEAKLMEVRMAITASTLRSAKSAKSSIALMESLGETCCVISSLLSSCASMGKDSGISYICGDRRAYVSLRLHAYEGIQLLQRRAEEGRVEGEGAAYGRREHVC